MKKVLSLVLALAMVLGSFSFVSAASYNDVTGTDVESAVDRLSTLGILTGYPDGSFKPSATITRAEFAAVAVRAKGLESAASAAKGLATGFNDVAPAHWASGYVGTAGKMGIINGVGNGLFAPEAPVKYEEAITMIVRALGYEAAAQTKGGYPYGYLIVANEIGLLDQVKGTQGAPATRGIVAQITDNALEVPMMIQVGFGQDTKWVVSGSKEHGDNAQEQYLLDSLGFDSVTGRSDVSSNKKKIVVNIEDKDEQDRVGKKSVTVEVNGNVDTYEVNGLLTKFWYKNDVVVFYALQEDAKFDAVEYDEKNEVTLVTEDENYEVAKNADIIIDGDDDIEVENFDADYAKVVLNDDDEIIWAEGYTFDGFIVAKEVKDDEIIGYGDDELKIKDYTIVKDGKTLAAEDLEDGDVVFYNNDEEFAVVTTITKAGKIDRVYTDGFRLDGTTYKVADIDTKYFDGKDLIDMDEDLSEELEEDEDEVTLFFNFAKKVAVVSGVDKDVNSSSFYGVLIKAPAITEGRRGQNYLSLDVRTENDAKAAYDLDYEALKDSKILKSTSTEANWELETNATGLLSHIDLSASQKLAAIGDVLKITVDEDGDVTKISIPEFDATTREDFKVTATYAKGATHDFRMTSSTVVFYDGNDEAIKIGEVKDEFELIKQGGTIYFEDGKAVAIVADTDADSTKTVVGLLNSVKKLSSGAYEFKVKVAGKTETFITDGTKGLTYDTTNVIKNKVVKLIVGEKSGKLLVDSSDVIRITAISGTSVDVASVSGRKITATVVGETYAKEFSLVDGYKIYNSNDTDFAEVKSARDLEGERATLYFDASSNYYVAYVVVGLTESGNNTRQYTYNGTVLLDGNTYIKLGDTAYPYTGAALTGLTEGTSKVIATFMTIRGEQVVTSVTAQ